MKQVHIKTETENRLTFTIPSTMGGTELVKFKEANREILAKAKLKPINSITIIEI